MTRFLRYLWRGGYSDERDPITNLSECDINNIVTSWTRVYNNKLSFGMEVFSRLFHEYPETQSLFKSLVQLKKEELRTKPMFKAHAITFMTGLNMVITNLENQDVVIAMLTKLGESHSHNHVESRHFEITSCQRIKLTQRIKWEQTFSFPMAKVIIEKLLSENGNVDNGTLDSWDRLITFMYSVILPQFPDGAGK